MTAQYNFGVSGNTRPLRVCASRTGVRCGMVSRLVAVSYACVLKISCRLKRVSDFLCLLRCGSAPSWSPLSRRCVCIAPRLFGRCAEWLRLALFGGQVAARNQIHDPLRARNSGFPFLVSVVLASVSKVRVYCPSSFGRCAGWRHVVLLAG